MFSSSQISNAVENTIEEIIPMLLIQNKLK